MFQVPCMFCAHFIVCVMSALRNGIGLLAESREALALALPRAQSFIDATIASSGHSLQRLTRDASSSSSGQPGPCSGASQLDSCAAGAIR